MAKLSPVFNDQTLTIDGAPANGYKIYVYAAGSSSPATTFANSSGTVPQTNPIIVNSLGYPTNGAIWLQEGQSYKFVLASPTDTTPPTSPIKTIDNVQGVNDASVSINQWQASGVTPTYASANSFTLQGDQTSEFHVGRRLQFTVASGSVYGTIASSVFSTLTTVTMQMDASNTLDAGLSIVNISLLRADKSALPKTTYNVTTINADLINQSQGADIASSATLNLDNATGNIVDVTGTTTITAITLSQGRERVVRFTGSLTLTNGANLVLPGAANITTAAGDFAVFRGYAAGVVRCSSYTRSDGTPIATVPISRGGTGATTAATAAAALGTIGAGQTWQDMTGSRAFNVSYTNSTGRSISVCATTATVGNYSMTVIVNGLILFANVSSFTTVSDQGYVTFIVPNGSSYQITCPQTLSTWTELR